MVYGISTRRQGRAEAHPGARGRPRRPGRPLRERHVYRLDGLRAGMAEYDRLVQYPNAVIVSYKPGADFRYLRAASGPPPRWAGPGPRAGPPHGETFLASLLRTRANHEAQDMVEEVLRQNPPLRRPHPLGGPLGPRRHGGRGPGHERGRRRRPRTTTSTSGGVALRDGGEAGQGVGGAYGPPRNRTTHSRHPTSGPEPGPPLRRAPGGAPGRCRPGGRGGVGRHRHQEHGGGGFDAPRTCGGISPVERDHGYRRGGGRPAAPTWPTCSTVRLVEAARCSRCLDPRSSRSSTRTTLSRRAASWRVDPDRAAQISADRRRQARRSSGSGRQERSRLLPSSPPKACRGRAAIE